MKKNVSKILYFGAPGLVKPIRKESDKPNPRARITDQKWRPQKWKI